MGSYWKAWDLWAITLSRRIASFAFSSTYRKHRKLTSILVLCLWHTSGKKSPINDFSVSLSIIFFQVLLFFPKKSMAPMTNKPSLALDSATQIRFWSDKKPILFSSLLRTKDNNTNLLSSPWKLSTTVTRTFWSRGYCFFSWNGRKWKHIKFMSRYQVIILWIFSIFITTFWKRDLLGFPPDLRKCE